MPVPVYKIKIYMSTTLKLKSPHKRFLILISSFLLLFSSCSLAAEPETSTDNSGPVSQYSVDGGVAENYEKNLTWGEKGHLYIHYMRPNAKSKDYDEWGVWIWQKAPRDQEGSLWGAVKDDFLNTVPYPMSRTRMKNIGGSGKDTDAFGTVYDIDMTREDIVDGRNGKPVSFDKANRVGFLIINLASMNGQSKWMSDGGADVYIEDFQSHWREDGSMHIFLSQGYCSDYTFIAGTKQEANPTLKDTTGNYRSKYTPIADAYKNRYPSTSSELKKIGIGYEIFVASFRDSDGDGMGDIRGIIDSLDYLKNDLKVQCIWMTPVFKCESYHGYDVTDYYQIDSRFGDIVDFEELVEECKERDIKLILDLVVNHTSRSNVWFVNSERANVSTDLLLDRVIKWRDIYHWKYLGDTVPYYDIDKKEYTSVKVEKHPDWHRDGDSNYFYYSKFGKDMPELNYDNQDARDLFIQVANFWLDKGVDGYRLDATKHIYMKDESEGNEGDIYASDIVAKKVTYDDELLEYISRPYDYTSNVTKNIAFWKEFAFSIKEDHPTAFLIGENLDGYGARIAPYYQALDSQFDFSNYYHIDEWALRKLDGHTTGKYSVDQEADSYYFYSRNNDDSVIDTIRNYPTGHRSDFVNSAFTSNHDLHRVLNHSSANSFTPMNVTNEKGYTMRDNKGKTIKFTSSKVEGNLVEQGKAKVTAAMSILNGGLSFIYYGDEIGMSSNTDSHVDTYHTPDYEDIWFRQPFKWGDEKITTGYSFGKYEVKWDLHNEVLLKGLDEQKKDPASMYSFYKALCEIKEKFGTSQKFEGDIYNIRDVVYWRVTGDNGTFHVYINTTSSQKSIVTAGTEFWYASANGEECTKSFIQGYSAVVTK